METTSLRYFSETLTLMKQLFIGLLFCSFFPVFAQQSGNQGALLEEQQPDRVMIIPFRNYNYLSDADYELATANNKTMSEISTVFRHGLDLNLSAQISTVYDSYSILQDTSITSAAELRKIYSMVRYTYQKPVDYASGNVNTVATHRADLFGNQVPEEPKKGTIVRKEVEEEEEQEFLNAVIDRSDLLPQLANAYSVDYFIFINQMELKTNYKHCLDRATNNFEREVLVHYSIYDAFGRQLKGEAISVVLGSNDKRLEDIIGNYLPQITQNIKTSLDKQISAQMSAQE